MALDSELALPAGVWVEGTASENATALTIQNLKESDVRMRIMPSGVAPADGFFGFRITSVNGFTNAKLSDLRPDGLGTRIFLQSVHDTGRVWLSYV